MAPKKVAMVPAVPCPYGPDTSPEAIMCYLCEGSKVCNSWAQIAAHLKNQHGVGARQLHGTYLWKQLHPEPALTQDEFDNVMPVAGQEDRFFCKGCGNTLGKRNAFRHFTQNQKHNLERAVVMNWVVVKDGFKLGNGAEGLHFTNSYQAFNQEQGALLAPDPNAFPLLAEAGLASTSSSTNASVLQDLQESMSALQRDVGQALQRDIEVLVPDVQLSVLAWTWGHPEEQVRRYTCPIPDAAPPRGLGNFECWLKENKGLKDVSARYANTAMHRFFNLLAFEGGDAVDHVGVLCAIYKQDLLPQLMQCPVMAMKYSWPKTIISALDHYCKFLCQECSRNRWDIAKLTIQQLMEETLEGYKKQSVDARRAQDTAKFKFDAERLESFPPKAAIQAAVEKAMVDLHMLCIGSKPAHCIAAANTIMAGIIYYNGFAGRSGEWHRMTKAHVQEQISQGKSYLICPDHKTAKTYGDLAKHIFPGTAQAMQMYMSLDQSNSELFFVPAAGGAAGHGASMSYYLKKFAATYFLMPEALAPTANLIRKQYHTVLMRMSRHGECLDLLSKVDAHSPAVAERVYTTTTIGDDAKLGKILFEVVMGEAVGWPSAEQFNFLAVPPEQVLLRHAAVEDLPGGEGPPDDADDGSDSLIPLGWGDGAEGESTFQEAFGSDDLEEFHFQEAIKLSRAHAEEGLVEEPPSMVALLGMDTAGSQDEANDSLTLLEGSMSEEDSCDGGAGPPSKRTKTSLNETQQSYLQTHAMQKFGGSMPTKAWFRELLQQGIHDNVFTVANTAEGLRSYMRRAVGDFKQFRKDLG